MTNNEDEYQCAICQGIYTKINNEEWNDKKALEENHRLFPEAKSWPQAIVCDDCFQRDIGKIKQMQKGVS